MSIDKERFIALAERKISRFVGMLTTLHIPSILYRPISKIFCWAADISDYEFISTDRSINTIFTRNTTLLYGNDFEQLSSPADGTVATFGIFDNSNPNVLPVKQSLIPITTNCRIHKNTNLFYIGVYLSPSDNHHICSAADWRIQHRNHFPGYLASVRPDRMKRIEANERVEYQGKWIHGYFSLTLIGALNVGSIHVPDDAQLSTNNKNDDSLCVGLVHSRSMNFYKHRMQKFGYFSMGSYVMLVFEAPQTFKFNCFVGQSLRKGFNLGSIF